MFRADKITRLLRALAVPQPLPSNRSYDAEASASRSRRKLLPVERTIRVGSEENRR